MSFENFFNIRKLLGCFFGSYLKFLQKNQILKQERVIFKYLKSVMGQHFFWMNMDKKKAEKIILLNSKYQDISVLWTLEVDTCIY